MATHVKHHVMVTEPKSCEYFMSVRSLQASAALSDERTAQCELIGVMSAVVKALIQAACLDANEDGREHREHAGTLGGYAPRSCTRLARELWNRA